MAKTNSVQKMTRLSILIALTVILQNLPFRLGTVEMTLGIIPVEIGAMIMGPTTGAVLGTVMGIASFLQCLGIFVPSAFGAQLLSMNPLFTLVICIASRAAMGYLVGVIFKALRKFDKTKLLSFGVAATSGAVLNSIFFTSLVIFFFYNTEYIKNMANSVGATNFVLFFFAFIGVNGIVEAAVSLLVGGSSAKVLSHVIKN